METTASSKEEAQAAVIEVACLRHSAVKSLKMMRMSQICFPADLLPLKDQAIILFCGLELAVLEYNLQCHRLVVQCHYFLNVR